MKKEDVFYYYYDEDYHSKGEILEVAKMVYGDMAKHSLDFIKIQNYVFMKNVKV